MLLPLSNFILLNTSTTTEIYSLSLHDALPILYPAVVAGAHYRDHVLAVDPDDPVGLHRPVFRPPGGDGAQCRAGHLLRSEEHTSELQSLTNLVCRLLLEKKNIKHDNNCDIA